MRAVATARIRIQSTRHGLPTARSGRASLEAPEDRVKQIVSAEADGIVGRQTRLAAASAIAERASSSLSILAVLRAMHATFALRAGSDIDSCRATSSGSGGIGWPGLPSISVAPAE